MIVSGTVPNRKEHGLRSNSYAMEVSIGKDEIDRILDLKTDLDHYGSLFDHAAQYLNLGWPLVAIDAETGENMGDRFSS